MGDDREQSGKPADEEPDVMAHKRVKKANEEPTAEGEDDAPDVEAHVWRSKK